MIQTELEDRHTTHKPGFASQVIFDARNRVLLRLIQHLGLERDARILDIGCGRGDMLRLLLASGYTNLYGLDIDPVCVDMASGYGSVYLGAIEDWQAHLPFPRFDVAICSHVLEHVANPSSVLRFMATTLSRISVLAVPNALSLGNVLKAFCGAVPPVNRGHLQIWDTAHFLNLLDIAGLTLISQPVTDCVTLLPYVFIQRTLGSDAVRMVSRIDVASFHVLPFVLPRLGISVICACRSHGS